MLVAPKFENSVLVTDDALLAARISALFARAGRYLPIIDGPRMRPDFDNEVLRRRNAIVKAGVRHVLIGGLTEAAADAMRPGWPSCTVSNKYGELAGAIAGSVPRTKGVLQWGPDNLGVAIYEARRQRQELQLDLDSSPLLDFVKAGTHLLVACERGDPLAEVVASNLAFSRDASFCIFDGLADKARDAWLEELYALGEGGDATGRFARLSQRVRDHLSNLDLARYKNVLFVTGGFPWGVAVPEVAATHMYRYPDFGRMAIEGIRASMSDSSSSRNALLIDPQSVEGSEILDIRRALIKNRTLIRAVRGRAATQTRVQFLLDLIPHDIIVISSHAGDAEGERLTYEFPDAEGRLRRLVVDQAVGIGRDEMDGKHEVTEFARFYSLDGIDWSDKKGLSELPIGSAMTTWSSLIESDDSHKLIVAREPIRRVIGSMAIQLYDGLWLYASDGFPPQSAPVVLNNACSSFHELSGRMMFAGARAYVGSLFPVTDAEAQEVGKAVLSKFLGEELHRAVWRTQQEVYDNCPRRPYVMVGLPFITIRHNTTDSVAYLNKAYEEAITHFAGLEKRASNDKERDKYRRFLILLEEEFKNFLGFQRSEELLP